MYRRLFLTLFLLGSFFVLAPRVLANSDNPSCSPTPTPQTTPAPTSVPPVSFNFPSCATMISQPGDKAHYLTGMHQIVGGPLLSGRDDVYTLASSNYLQCYCSDTSEKGIQTNWLRTNDPISGWLFVNGAQWNLGDANYAAQNSDFSCVAKPEPTSVPPNNPSSGGGNGGSVGAPVCDSIKPLPPTNLKVVRTGTTAKLTWTETANTTHYSIVYGTQPGKYEYGVVNTGKTNTFTVGSLDLNKKYYFAVNSVNNCTPSDLTPSGEVLGAGTVLGLASTGSWDQIALLFAVGVMSLILMVGLTKLISLCENNENIQIAIKTVKKLTSTFITHIRFQLQSGHLLSLGSLLQPGSAQLCFFTQGSPPGLPPNPFWSVSRAPVYSFA